MNADRPGLEMSASGEYTDLRRRPRASPGSTNSGQAWGNAPNMRTPAAERAVEAGAMLTSG